VGGDPSFLAAVMVDGAVNATVANVVLHAGASTGIAWGGDVKGLLLDRITVFDAGGGGIGALYNSNVNATGIIISNSTVHDVGNVYMSQPAGIALGGSQVKEREKKKRKKKEKEKEKKKKRKRKEREGERLQFVVMPHYFTLSLLLLLVESYDLKIGICLASTPSTCTINGTSCLFGMLDMSSKACMAFSGKGMVKVSPTLAGSEILAYDIYAYPGAKDCSGSTPIAFSSAPVSGKCVSGNTSGRLVRKILAG